MGRNAVKFVLATKVTLPRRLGPRDREAIARLRAAAYELNRLSNGGGGIDADASHLADLADALNLLANVLKRARACTRRPS